MKNAYELLKSVLHEINIKLAELCGLLLFGVVMLLTADVIFRALGRPIPGLTTLGVLVMLAVIYLGLARCEELGEHTEIDMFIHRLPPKWNRINSIVVKLLNLLTVGILLWVSINNYLMSYKTKESFADVVKIPMWPSKLAVMIGSASSRRYTIGHHWERATTESGK